MNRSLATAIGFGLLLVVSPAGAGDDGDGGLDVRWSTGFELRLKDFPSSENDDNRTSYIDKYEFTRNKRRHPPLELGLSQATLDLLAADETPVLQFRFRSPTSGASVSGDGFFLDQTFLNQRGELYLRPDGVSADLEYRRSRVDELRQFPIPTGTGLQAYGAVFNDNSRPNDRFFIRRTGVDGEFRFRPDELFDLERGSAESLFLSEIALRAGIEEREGQRQLRTLLSTGDALGTPPGTSSTSRWRGLTNPVNQDFWNAGGGLVFSPLGLFTVSFDFDHERLTEHSPVITNGDINLFDANIRVDGDRSLRSWGFVPDTERDTASAQFHAAIGDRVEIHGGGQYSELRQQDNRTPLQDRNGLQRNRVRFWSGSLAFDAKLLDGVSLDAYAKFDRRRNEIDQTTALFNPFSDEVQVDPFVRSVRRLETGGELLWRPAPRSQIGIGARVLQIDRDRDFAQQDPTAGQQVTKLNTLLGGRSRSVTSYLRTVLRPAQGLRLSGEVGYREAPSTGYNRELDNMGYGKGRASYTWALSRPVTFSLFGQGEKGRNRDFRQFGETAGPRDRDFDRTRFSYGGTVSGSPVDGVTLYVSGFQHRDDQDFDLIRSNVRRYEELRPTVLNFFRDSNIEYRSNLVNAIVGGSWAIDERTSFDVSYSFTRTNTRIRSQSPTTNLIDGPGRIRSDVHAVDFKLGRQLLDGLRVSAGYRFDRYRDLTDVTGTSSVAPFDFTASVHTVVLGVTLTSDLLADH